MHLYHYVSRLSFIFAVVVGALTACSSAEPTKCGGSGGGGGDHTGSPTGTCNAASDCEAYDCFDVSCPAHACVYTQVPYGTASMTQKVGDCRRLVCYKILMEEVDDSDLPADDGNDCTQETCDNGDVKHAPMPAGTPCSKGSTCIGGTCS